MKLPDDWAHFRSNPFEKNLPVDVVIRADPEPDSGAWDLIWVKADRIEVIRVGLNLCSSLSSLLLLVRVRMKMFPRFSTLHILFLFVWLGLAFRCTNLFDNVRVGQMNQSFDVELWCDKYR